MISDNVTSGNLVLLQDTREMIKNVSTYWRSGTSSNLQWVFFLFNFFLQV